MIQNNPNLISTDKSASELSQQLDDLPKAEVKPADRQVVEVEQNRFDKIIKQEGVGFSVRDGAEQSNAKNVADHLNSLMAGGLQRANKKAAELEDKDQFEAFEVEESDVHHLKIPVEATQASEQISEYLYDEIDFVGDENFLSLEWE